jgi:transcriptional regulator with XRE-family HTH domain
MDNAIGQFLRARREQVRPEDVDLVPGGRRRVAGLRREEVAMLAGVSTDYYVRLEQGRERHPSPQVVEALARALDLDEEAGAHLQALAGPRRARPRRRERVSPTLLAMMDAWTATPALILDRCLRVLADNALGRALYAGHDHSRDLVRLVFLDASARDLYPDRDRVARDTVAALRAATGVDPDDPAFIETVGELSVKSPEFRKLWARHDIRRKTHDAKRFHHPLVGELALSFEALTVNGAPGQQLVVYHAEPGSPSAEALSILGSLTA